jgi:hypothetical protein
MIPHLRRSQVPGYCSSMISRTTLRLVREATAFRMVRIELTVPTLLADHASEIFLCHAQFEDRGGIAVRLLHLDGIGVIHQLPRQKLD